MQCARFFNSHWHDDSRRVGDVVVWCLDERRVVAADNVSAGGKPRGEKGLEWEKETAQHQQQPLLERVVEKPFWKAREPAL